MVLDILYDPQDPQDRKDWEKYVREKFKVTGDSIRADIVKIKKVR